MNLIPTVIATLETSKLSHTMCCSVHHCSPAVLFYCKCWGDSWIDQDQACHQPGGGLCSAYICCCTMMNGASRSRALKNQDHWSCTPAMAHSVHAASPISAATEPPSRYHHHSCSHSKYSPCQCRQLIRTGNEYLDCHNCNYTAKITWGREHQRSPDK